MMTDNFCSYLQNRLIQTSQTEGQLYSDTSPSSIHCSLLKPSTTVTRDSQMSVTTVLALATLDGTT
jgi:hypothetical protein